jgi:chemotaxis-related protein WspD
MSSDAPYLPIADGDGDGRGDACWNTIGVGGDRSCPELVAAIHCRNCPVFATSARAFFDRDAPEGYLAEWTRALDGSDASDEDVSVATRDRLGVVLFRLGAEWLAIRARVVVEVTGVRPVHRIPHRTNAVVAGLANLRGQLHLCASLHGLLGVTPAAASAGHGGLAAARSSRMLVIRQGSETWVFAAEEVLGVPRVPPGLLRNVPSTLANPSVSFSQAVFDWGGRSVGLLDEDRLFAALRSLGA